MGHLRKMSNLVVLSFVFCFILTLSFSCADKNEKVVESTYDREVVPTIRTHNDTMYISDSGRIRFKVIGETMLLFDNAKDPYTLFPDKAYMEEYDTIMSVITTLRADSVWNYNKRKLWKLRGRVNIVNIEGKSFDSEELFWDEEKDRVYSDLSVVINEPNKIAIRAYSFESNRNMTEYTFKRAYNVDYYVNEDEDQHNSQKGDTIEK